MKTDEGKKYFSTVEAGKLLHISRIAVFNKIKNGRLPAIKMGRNYVINREDLEAEMGKKLTQKDLNQIDLAVKKAIKDYRDAFERLSKE